MEHLLLDDRGVFVLPLVLRLEELEQGRQANLCDKALEDRHTWSRLQRIQGELENVEQCMQGAEVHHGLHTYRPRIPDTKLPYIACAVRVCSRLGRFGAHNVRYHAQR